MCIRDRFNNYPLWNGYTQADVAGEVFRSDALQVRLEKRAFGNANSALGVMTIVFSYTLNKEYALLCCVGQNWQTTTAATLQLSPNGQTLSLIHI